MADFKRIYEKVNRNLQAAFQKQANYYTRQRREVKYAVSSLVLRCTHVLSSAADAVSAKLAP